MNAAAAVNPRDLSPEALVEELISAVKRERQNQATLSMADLVDPQTEELRERVRDLKQEIIRRLQ